MIKRNTNIILPIAVILWTVSFYKFILIPSSLFSPIKNYLIMAVVFFFSMKNTKRGLFEKDMLFRKEFIIYFILFIINLLTTLYFRDQGIHTSFLAWYPLLLIFYYPIFKTWNITTIKWEKILFIIHSIILICFISQYVFINVQLFDLDTKFEYLEYENRIRIFSGGVLTLGGLYHLNKFLYKNNKLNLIFYLITTFVVFLQGFRMIILCYFIVSIFLYIKTKKLKISFKLLTVSFCILITINLLTHVPIVETKISEMQKRNEHANFENEDYIRVLLVNYFYSEHFKNKIELIAGSGLTFINTETNKYVSKYSKYRSDLAIDYHYYPVDMGIIGLSWETGIPFTIVLIILLINIIRMKVPPQFYYLGAWELMVLMSSITNPICYYHSNMIYHALVLIILDKVTQEHKTYNQNLLT